MGFSIGGILGGITGLIGANKQAKATRDAANTAAQAQRDAAEMALKAQREAMTRSENFTREGQRTVADLYEQSRGVGARNLSNLEFLTTGYKPQGSELDDYYGISDIERKIADLQKQISSQAKVNNLDNALAREQAKKDNAGAVAARDAKVKSLYTQLNNMNSNNRKNGRAGFSAEFLNSAQGANNTEKMMSDRSKKIYDEIDRLNAQKFDGTDTQIGDMVSNNASLDQTSQAYSGSYLSGLQKQLGQLTQEKAEKVRLRDTQGFQAPNHKNSESYNWQKRENERALNAQMAARGGFNSSEALYRLNQSNMQLSANEEQKFYNRIAGLANIGQNANAATAQAAQGFATGMGSSAIQTGQGASKIYQGVGDANSQAALTAGAANASQWQPMIDMGAGLFNNWNNSRITRNNSIPSIADGPSKFYG